MSTAGAAVVRGGKPVRFPELPPSLPRRGWTVLRRVGGRLFALLGWRIEGNFPDLPKLVVIVAPHTSNWDFFIALFADLGLDLKASFLGKHTIFRFPVRGWLLRLGGVPVRRDARHNVVEQMQVVFAAHDQLVLAIAPEGTRKRVTEWKSGFWHIARAARVPIVPVALDYARRAVVIGAPFTPGPSFESDVRELRQFFARATPKHPHLR